MNRRSHGSSRQRDNSYPSQGYPRSSGGDNVLYPGATSTENPRGRQDQYSQQNMQRHHQGQSHGNHRSSGRGGAVFQGLGAASYDMPPDYQDSFLQNQNQSFQSHMYSSGPQQVHAQEALLRSTQASTQMLYDVFDYTIGMLEELEKHENMQGRKAPKNSGIFAHLFAPDYVKPEPEVTAGIEAELQCLSVQMRYSPKEVTNDSIKKELVEQTLKWLAARDEAKLEPGKVDWYCKNVLEVLLFGSPGEMPPRKRLKADEITTEQVNEAMFQLAKGRHFGEEQDKQFHKDPEKKAKSKKKRHGGSPREGAFRLKSFCDSRKDKDLMQALEPYVADIGMEIA